MERRGLFHAGIGEYRSSGTFHGASAITSHLARPSVRKIVIRYSRVQTNRKV